MGKNAGVLKKKIAVLAPAVILDNETFSGFAVVETPDGLHQRPLKELIKYANLERYRDCTIAYEHNGCTASGRSITSMLFLAMGYGAKVRVSVNGNGVSRECFEGLVARINSNLDDPKNPYLTYSGL